MQRIEGMEKLFLSTFLLGQELNVVHQQNVNVTKLVAEAGHLVVTQRVDHLIGEFLAGEVADGGLGLATFDLMSDGLHEMGLAHANTAVKEEGVIRLGRAFCDRQGGGVGKLVARADDERVKSVSRVELSSAVPVKATLVGWSGGEFCGYSPESAIMPHRCGRR